MNNYLNYKESFGLYVHIPFCQKKCNYCDFYSIKSESSIIKQFVESLINEIDIYSKIIENKNLKTIYIGGGTPSILSVDQLQSIIKKIDKSFLLKKNIEITIEANPESLNLEKIIGYKNLGINRLSLGVQSFNNEELKFLGRIHDREGALEVINNIQKYYDNYSLDIIFAIPNQTFEMFVYNIETVITINPNHLSLYNLQIEKDTVLYNRYLNKEFDIVSEDMDYKMYNFAIEKLKENNFLQYEISNFSKQGYQSEHNKIYWKYKPYLGIGPSSHGFNGKNRYKNINNIKKYIKCLDQNRLPIKEIRNLEKEDLISEMMMMGLRLIEGVSKDEFNKRFDLDLNKYYSNTIKKMKSYGLIEENKEKIYLTKKGINLGNIVISEFLI